MPAANGVVVANATVRDDAGSSPGVRTNGEDVTERARPCLTPRFNHDDLAVLHRVECPLLRVVSPTVADKQVFTPWNKSKSRSGAHQFLLRMQGAHSVDRHVVQATLPELR